MPGFVPNSQGQQLYAPGQGPITEQVPSLEQMGGQAIAAEPRGAMDVPLDANAQAGQMELQASAAYDEESVFETLGNVFGEYLQRAAGQPAGLLRAKVAGNGKAGKLGTREHCEAGGLLNAIRGYGFQGANVGVKQSDFPDRDRDADEAEDGSDLEEPDADDTDVYEPHHAVPYDDNGKPRMSRKAGMARMSQLSAGREFTPGEDCAYCGVSMEKGDAGVCNRCGHDYDSGKDRKFGKQAVTGSHGVPMVSIDGDMQQSSAGEGDTSSLLYAPWTQNGADAWKDLEPYTGKGAGKGNSVFGGKLADKQANGDMLAFKAWKATGLSDEEADRKAGESLETPVIAKEKQARVEPLPRWAPPGPPRAFPGLMGQPGVNNFLTSLGLGFDAQGFVQDKRAMLGDTGDTTPDPFGGGMILGQQQASQNPMDNPGTLLEAGTDNSQEDTTMQPSDHGQHDAVVAPYDALADAIHVNGFKLGAFAQGFVQHCQAEGLPEPQICELAAKCATISDALAEELEPLTKQAISPGGFKSWGPAIVQHGKRMLPFLGKAAPGAAPLVGRPGVNMASSASKMWQAASSGADDVAKSVWQYGAKQPLPPPPARPFNAWQSTANATGPAVATAAKPVASWTAQNMPTFKPAIDAFQAGGATQKALVARGALGAGVGSARDLYDYSQGNEYQGYAGQYGALGAGSAAVGVPGVRRLLTGQGPRLGLAGVAERAINRTPFLRNNVAAPLYGGLQGSGAGYGAGWVADNAVQSVTGEDPGLRNYGALLGGGAGGFSRSPFGRGLLNRVGAPGAAQALSAGGVGGLATAATAADFAPLVGAPIAAANRMQGGRDVLEMASKEVGAPTTDAKGQPLPAGDLASNLRVAVEEKAKTIGTAAGRAEAERLMSGVADTVKTHTGVDLHDYVTRDQTGKPALNLEPVIKSFEARGEAHVLQKLETDPAFRQKAIDAFAAGSPELAGMAKKFGAVDANGRITEASLTQGLSNLSGVGGMKTLLTQAGMDWAVPLVEWAMQDPMGAAMVGGGMLMLMGGLLAGGTTTGLLGAGAMALGASGLGGQLMGQAGQMLGFGKQPGPTTPHEMPGADLPADQAGIGTVLTPEASRQVQQAPAGTGTVLAAPPPDLRQVAQQLMPRLQQHLPDVSLQELTDLLQQARISPDQIGPEDINPAFLQNLAGRIQAQRPASIAGDMGTAGLSAGW